MGTHQPSSFSGSNTLAAIRKPIHAAKHWIGSTSQTTVNTIIEALSIMATKESQITYQAHSVSECLNNLIARFGDRLGKLTDIDKLDLLGILSFWHSCNTQHKESEMDAITLGEYLDLNRELQIATSRDLDEALTTLADCSESDAITLLVTIPQQLRDECYS